MNGKNNQTNLVIKLTELKLEEKRLNTDITHFVRQNTMLDFARMKELNNLKTGLKSKIKAIEAEIVPNIIA